MLFIVQSTIIGLQFTYFRRASEIKIEKPLRKGLQGPILIENCLRRKVLFDTGLFIPRSFRTPDLSKFKRRLLANIKLQSRPI